MNHKVSTHFLSSNPHSLLRELPWIQGSCVHRGTAWAEHQGLQEEPGHVLSFNVHPHRPPPAGHFEEKSTETKPKATIPPSLSFQRCQPGLLQLCSVEFLFYCCVLLV
uniref:Uncharacterized protein n=1 Tax=Zonotrichia albicollis TaxID=44394 RepID=A0A8D2MAN7_ZONAL